MRGTYRGHDVISMPPPSAGGTLLVEMLNILERFSFGELSEDVRSHLMLEAEKLAYADRATFLGDPTASTSRSTG